MTVNEAIENLKMILEEATEDEHSVCYVTSCDKDGLEMAIEALEKQIPKKILRGTITRDTACYCSVCKSYVCFEDVYKDDYCPKCGQRIDWT